MTAQTEKQKETKWEYDVNDAARALALSNEEETEQGDRIHARANRLAKENDYGLSDKELSWYAKRFIYLVNHKSYIPAAVILQFLTDINFHTECSDFIRGTASKYIID